MLLSQRPLTRTDSDWRLLTRRGEERVRTADEALRRGMNVLITGERGAGRTSLLHQVGRRLRDAGLHVVLVDGAAWATPQEAIDAIALAYAATPRAGTPVANASAEDASVRIEALLRGRRRSGGVATLDPSPLTELGSDGAYVLIDNLGGHVAHDLFGRHRDTMWTLRIRWCAAADGADSSIMTPPADVFWEKHVRISRMDPDEVLDLIDRRVEAAEVGDPDVPQVRQARDDLAERLDRPLARDVMATLARVVGTQGDGVVPGDPHRLSRALESGGRRAAALLYEMEVLARPVHAGDEELGRRLGISRARISQLLGDLQEAGLVRSFDQSRRKMYEPVPLP